MVGATAEVMSRGAKGFAHEEEVWASVEAGSTCGGARIDEEQLCSTLTGLPVRFASCGQGSRGMRR
jgi:hypothetical protein